MSFEGYYQILCEQGHFSGCDCYDNPVFGRTTMPQWEENFEECIIWKCHCGANAAWWNLVNTTNGSYCDCHNGCEFCDEGRIDGYVELEILEEVKKETCLCCGHEKIIAGARHKIPEGKGHLVEK